MKAKKLAADASEGALFSGSLSTPYSALLKGRRPKDGLGGWTLYTSGLKIAADKLVTGVEEDASGAWESHFVVYPTFYLYRHHLELQIKQIGYRMARRSMPKKHGLMQLWSEVRGLLDDFYNQDRGLREQYDRIGALLRPLDQLDPTSEGFRYPFDDRGALTVSEDIVWLNLRALKVRVAEVSGLLDNFV